MASPPSSRTLSWLQQVQEADPQWQKNYIRPVVYEFSNGRTFTWRPDQYTTPGP